MGLKIYTAVNSHGRIKPVLYALLVWFSRQYRSPVQNKRSDPSSQLFQRPDPGL